MMGLDKAPPTSEFRVEIPATISQELGGGYYLIAHYVPIQIQAKGEPPTLISISTVFKASQLKTESVPKNTERKAIEGLAPSVPLPIVSSSPDIAPASFTQQEHKRWKLVVSEPKAVKLQTWKLDGEFAN